MHMCVQVWIIFILISSILLLNLLIAIFNNKFNDFVQVFRPLHCNVAPQSPLLWFNLLLQSAPKQDHTTHFCSSSFLVFFSIVRRFITSLFFGVVDFTTLTYQLLWHICAPTSYACTVITGRRRRMVHTTDEKYPAG